VVPDVAPEPSKDYYLVQEPDRCLFKFEDESGFVLLEESSAVPDQIEISLPKTKHYEGTNFTAVVRFRNRATRTAGVPTTVHYRVDDLTGKTLIQDWTSITTGSEVSIPITPAMNAIVGDSNAVERRQLMVKADSGLSTQVVSKAVWHIRNIFGIE
jgi:hypothetical protein